MGLAAVMALGHHIGRGKDISGLGDFPIEDLVGQPDATAFLPEIEQDTAPRPAEVAQSRLECSRQSQRTEPSALPVRHSECRWTMGGSPSRTPLQIS
jgi:hypothetical protein